MTIMQIISNLELGGAQEVVRTLVKYLVLEGQDVVVCTFKDGPIRQDIEELGVPVEILPEITNSVFQLPQFIRALFRLRSNLKHLAGKYQVEVIQTHLLRKLDFLVLTLRGHNSIRRIFWTIHNSNFILREEHLPRYKWLLGLKRSIYALLYRLGAYWVDGFIAVSGEVKSSIEENIGKVESKIFIIQNGVDLPKYKLHVNGEILLQNLGFHRGDKILTVVGMLKEQKGHRYLIDAVAMFISRFANLQILIIGDGDLRSQLENQVVGLNLCNNIHFLGIRDDVPQLLAISDFFVLPSLWEGLPMALVEAMACSLPIIATRVSGSQEVIVHGETGLLVPPGNSKNLARAIIRLLSNPSDAEKMGEAARKHVEIFYNAQKQAQEHLNLYNIR